MKKSRKIQISLPEQLWFEMPNKNLDREMKKSFEKRNVLNVLSSLSSLESFQTTPNFFFEERKQNLDKFFRQRGMLIPFF